MTGTIGKVKCTIDDMTEPKTVQALLTVILTVAIAYMFMAGRVVPEQLYYAWFAMIGIYMELPSRKRASVSINAQPE